MDDHSTDNTIKVLESYQAKDKRIKWYNRPENRPKGANACRNYGLEISTGEFVIFYDSDDLMLHNKLEMALSAIKKNDFVVTRSLNFKEDRYFEIPNYPPAGYHFNLQDFFAARFFWITDDVLIRKQAINNLRFDETLQSGQEYNFFCQMLLCTVKGISLTEVTSHRRLHSNSIQATQKKEELKLHTNRYDSYRKTFLLAQQQLGKPEKRFLLKRITKHILGLRRLGKSPTELKNLLNLLKDSMSRYEFIILLFADQFVKITGRGDTFFAKYIEKRMQP